MHRFRFWLLVPVCGLMVCGPPATVKPEAPARYFTNLVYAPAVERYRKTVEEKFRAQDRSYILSLLSYGIASFYDLNLEQARKAFFAAYKVDAGDRPEAAKLYDWLVVDSRTVYKLRKRERELVHFYLGLCYLLQNNPQEALVEFRKLRQYDQDASKLPIVNFYLGLIYEKLGKPDDARIEYQGLAQIADTGTVIFNLAQELLAGIADHEVPDSGQMELIVQIDHQTAGSIGRTEVWLDSLGVIATIPELMDSFPVRLSGAEATRKAAQEAGAKAARLALRVLGALLLEKALPGYGEELADDIADITLGKEEENRDTRAWGYAPLNFSFARLKIPVNTCRVRLRFYDRSGTLTGYCDYPLATGGRAGFCDRHEGRYRTWFIIAGLAEEFYGY
ncbi:MAG: tetratricopeptide repeat protein [candidate division WOR-3 bacterium]